MHDALFHATTNVDSHHIKVSVVRKLDELVGKSADIHHKLFDAIIGTYELISPHHSVSFNDVVELIHKLRMLNGLLAQGPVEFES